MKLYFDTNIYEFMSKKAEEVAVRSIIDEFGHDVEVSGENITETLATPDERQRIFQIAAIVTTAKELEPHPQSWTQAEEVRSEILRCRPGWLRHAPSRKLVRKATSMLEGNKQRWLDMKAMELPSPGVFAVYYRDFREGVAKYADTQRALRDSIRNPESNFSIMRETSGNQRTVESSMQFTAYNYWRYECLSAWFQAIVRRIPESRDYADWLCPYLKEKAFQDLSYSKFWLEEVDPTYMPKNHISGLANYYQLHLKLSPGNASDQIHACKLLDVDLFITADQRFHRILEIIVQQHYPHIRKPVLIDRSADSIAGELRRVLLTI